MNKWTPSQYIELLVSNPQRESSQRHDYHEQPFYLILSVDSVPHTWGTSWLVQYNTLLARVEHLAQLDESIGTSHIDGQIQDWPTWPVSSLDCMFWIDWRLTLNSNGILISNICRTLNRGHCMVCEWNCRHRTAYALGSMCNLCE